MTASEERVVYINGAMVRESEARISVRDLALVYGDAVFDTARTFGGALFMLEEHIERLFASLDYCRIAPGLTRAEFIAATQEVVAANRSRLRDGEDYWVTIRVTGGQQAFDGEPLGRSAPSVIIDCIPLPLRARAAFFRDGIEAVTPARRRVPPEALSPHAKTLNYMNMTLAQREVTAVKPGAWALMCDRNGDLAEGPGANFFVVKDGAVLTPSDEFVLAGVSRQVAIELCGELGLDLVETDLSMQAGLTADEAFFTSTSLCLCPVASLNGRRYPAGAPGPVTKRLMDAFAARVGYDYVGQYLRFLSNQAANPGL